MPRTCPVTMPPCVARTSSISWTASSARISRVSELACPAARAPTSKGARSARTWKRPSGPVSVRSSGRVAMGGMVSTRAPATGAPSASTTMPRSRIPSSARLSSTVSPARTSAVSIAPRQRSVVTSTRPDGVPSKTATPCSSVTTRRAPNTRCVPLRQAITVTPAAGLTSSANSTSTRSVPFVAAVATGTTARRPAASSSSPGAPAARGPLRATSDCASLPGDPPSLGVP